MKKASKKVVFFGNERLATGVSARPLTIQALVDNGYDVIRIIAKRENNGKNLNKKLEVEEIAASHNIPISFDSSLGQASEELRQLKPDIGIVVAYGLIIPEKLIDLFPNGILNIHPSLLPRGRGPAPIEDTILSGVRETGVSIMRLSEEMDKGPVLAQASVSLKGNETKQDLADHLLEKGSQLLINCLDDLFAGQDRSSLPQDESKATYTHKINKSDGIIDWSKPAEVSERQIRAYANWPKSRTVLNGMELIITQAAVVEESGPAGTYKSDQNNLIIFTSDKALSIKRLQPAGKKEMSVDEFIRGYGARL